MHISFSYRRLRNSLFVFWTLLFLGGLSVELWKAIVGRHTLRSVVYFLGLSYEQNLPTWYSASLLLLAAVSLLLIASKQLRERGAYRWHWAVLSGTFFYISLDETVTLHEDLSGFFDLGGFFFFGWVIPATVFVLVFGLSYIPFLRHLPRQYRNRFIVSGAVYVGGALGVEFLLGYWTDMAGTKNLGYGLIDLTEESMEIMGVTLFLLTLVAYMQETFVAPSSDEKEGYGEGEG